MVGHGLRLDCFRPKMHFLRKSLLRFILGLILACCTPLCSLVQASSVKCKPSTISSYERCGTYPDGVRDLDCFRQQNMETISMVSRCVWTPGDHTSNTTYTLIIEQAHKPCRVYDNISGISQTITLFGKYNMTVHVVEKSDPNNCTKAFFKGSPKHMVRCGPPDKVTFSRHSRRLEVNVSWRQQEMKDIQRYSVRYKALDSLSWSESLVRSQDRERCTVGNLTSSLAYEVQVQCVSNHKCSQCPWSEIHTVPPELTVQPVILKVKAAEIAPRKGCRLLTVTWKLPVSEGFEGYNVTIEKASGEEPCDWIHTARPEVTLILSNSEYHLNITAFNRASTSPAASQTILPQEGMDTGAGKLNVTFNSNTSYTLSWKDDLIKKYSCYSVEWGRKGYKAAYKSFFENANNYKTISLKNDPFEPYKRYNIALHTRPDKDPCNLKRVNDSESTYGRMQVYFTEGSPISAPTNISGHSVMRNSMVLQWLSVPEEDLRGFLLGYIIHYTEYDQKETEKNITVDPASNSHELGDLKSGTAYLVQISAFTRAGAGVRSRASLFKTNPQGYGILIGVITAAAVVAIVLIFGPPLLKRAKVVLWPSIPNPGNSNTMQKIDGPYELELLEPINTEKLEEWDTNSLHIVEKGPETNPAGSSSPALPYPLHDTEAEGDSDSEPPSPDVTCNWFQRDTSDAAGDLSPGSVTAATHSDTQQKDFQSSPFAFPSDYTTMEMFQQATPQSIPAAAVSEAVALQPQDTDRTGTRSGLDYVRQHSTSPSESSKELSTFL
ncbi:interleukin-31 receptor subunit alpha [Centroberyx affinis]|uniref:interleukin-31 receptor subunit alpha n=1 Tax=Centroberyx affinis TaxID=166261 RepID=UPI003A5BBCFF